jgi:hypothetical protein
MTGADCPGMDTDCRKRACVDGECGTFTISAHTRCDDNGVGVCTGTGACIGCIDDTDCMGGVCTGNECSGTTQIATAGPGLGAAVLDDAYDGTLASMTCVDLVVGTWTMNLVATAKVELAMTHARVGDLKIKLVSPSGTVITLMSQPGEAEAADDATAMGGNLPGLSPGFPITFEAVGLDSAEDMGLGLAAGDTVCGTDGLCSYVPDPGACAPGSLDTLVGEPADGTWQLCVGDNLLGEGGTIDQVTLTLEKSGP